METWGVTPDMVNEIRVNFFDKVSSKNPDFCAKDLERVKTDDRWMIRFVAAQENNIEAASQMIYDCLQWRKEFGTNELSTKSMPKQLFDKGTLFIHNKDAFGKPLLIFKAKHHLKGTEDLDNLKKFIVYHFELIERVANGDQISIIFDMDETGWNNMDMDFIRYLITLLKTYYPYFVNYLMIFEMPWLLNAAWKIIKTWLPAKFVDRVKFVNKKTIKEFIDADNQLAEWGGKDSFKYTFRDEDYPNLAAEQRSRPAVQPRNRDNMQLKLDDSQDFHESSAKTPSPRNNNMMAEPISIRRTNVEATEGGHLVQVPDRVILAKDNSDKVCGRFQVRNATQDTLLFKIKTTAPEKFHVRPTIGLLEANASGTVIITVQSEKYLRSIIHERFQVQVVIAPKQLLDGINGNDNEILGDLSKVWKKIYNTDIRMENHRVGCTLDPAIAESLNGGGGGGGGGTPVVTMNEEEMRKGLNQIEQRIVENITNTMTKKVSRVEKILYVITGLIFLLLLSVWWTPSSRNDYCVKQ